MLILPPLLLLATYHCAPYCTGTITKALVLQCNEIMFSGCKGRVAANGPMNETFLAFPYLGGLTFSSQDIDNIMLYRAELGIGDAMITEPPAVEMDEEHGKKCLWQVTWAAPMFRLHDCKIFVKSSTPYDVNIKWDTTHPSCSYGTKDDDPRRKDDWSSFMSLLAATRPLQPEYLIPTQHCRTSAFVMVPVQ